MNWCFTSLRMIGLKFRKPLFVIGKFSTKMTNQKWAEGLWPKLTALLGALHELYVVSLDALNLKHKHPSLSLYSHCKFAKAGPKPTLAMMHSVSIHQQQITL